MLNWAAQRQANMSNGAHEGLQNRYLQEREHNVSGNHRDRAVPSGGDSELYGSPQGAGQINSILWS